MSASVLQPTPLPKPRSEMTEADWLAQNEIRYKTWQNAAGLIIESHERFLLVCDAKTSKWSFPKGAPEAMDGDVPLVTAAREVYEETHLIEEVDQVVTDEEVKKFPWDNVFFFATLVEGHEEQVKVQSDETSGARWFTMKEMKALGYKANQGVKYFLQKYG